MAEPTPIDLINAKIEALRYELDTLDATVVAEAKKPWYLDVATLISFGALLFSLGTTVISYRRDQQQDIENLRTELRTLLQRLAELPKANAEAIAQHPNDPALVATLSGYIAQENEFLANQAAEIAKHLPADRVSAVENYAIGLALGNTSDLDGEKRFVDTALQEAQTSFDFNTEIACLRTEGVLDFISGKPADGRVEFQRALGIFSRYPKYNQYMQDSYNLSTEVSWGYAELNTQSPTLALQHASNAEQLVGRMAPGPQTDQYRMQVRQLFSQIQSGQPRPAQSGSPGPGWTLPNDGR